MQREIEFRAKSKYNNEFVYGDLIKIHTKNGSGYGIKKNPYHINDNCVNPIPDEIIPETVGQLWATINNNKYFEGDIFSVGLFTNVTYVIIYNDIKKCVSFIQISEYKKLKRGDELSRLNILSNLGYAKVELIEKYNPTLLGNIFDNAELLNK